MGIITVLIVIVLGIAYLDRKRNMSNDEAKLLQQFISPSKAKRINIFIYGHSATGKSTIIQRLFTLGKQEQKSTINFDFGKYEVLEDFGKKRKIKFAVADYRGQDPTQILVGLQKKALIDCLLFVVDIAPAYSPSSTKYTKDELLGMMAKDVEKSISERVKEHDAYMSKFLIQIIFNFAVNPNLKSVYFLINKIDILETLQKLAIIDIKLDIEEYAKSFYIHTIEELNRFCYQHNVVDFQTYCISATDYKNIHNVLANIVSTYNSKN